jgi:hypothetical protein
MKCKSDNGTRKANQFSVVFESGKFYTLPYGTAEEVG